MTEGPPNPDIDALREKMDDLSDQLKALEKEVGMDISPGEYVCDWVELVDTRGNRTLLTGLVEMRFRVEDVPGDHQGPRLNNWRVLIQAEGRIDEAGVPTGIKYGTTYVLSDEQEHVQLYDLIPANERVREQIQECSGLHAQVSGTLLSEEPGDDIGRLNVVDINC